MVTRTVSRCLSLAPILVLGLVSPSAHGDSTASLRVPIEVRTDSIQAMIEQAVPQKIEQLGAWSFQGDTGLRYGAWRSPISVHTTQNAVRVQARIGYAVAACRRMKKPWPLQGHVCPQIAQCGFGEPLPMIDVTIDVSGAWSGDWSFVPRVTTSTSVARPCRFTFANIDVSRHAVGALERQIASAAERIAGQLHFRARAEQVWSGVVATPIGHQQWLSWKLDSVTVEPPRFMPGRVTSFATLAATATVIGAPTAPAATPLPARLTVGSSAPASTAWRLDTEASWGDINKAAAKAFGEQSAGSGMTISLESMSGASNGRVQADFSLKGAPIARLSISADLAYDAAGDMVSLKNLRIETDPAALGAALDTRSFVADAESKMQWNLKPLLQPTVDDVNAKLNALGLKSGAADPGMRVEALKVTANGLSLTVVVPGHLRL